MSSASRPGGGGGRFGQKLHRDAVHTSIRTPLALLVLAAAALGGCRKPAAEQAGQAAPARPLARLTAQRVIVAPAYSVREGDPLGWAAGIPRQREWLRQLDDEVAFALKERGLESAWVYPEALARGFQRNPSLSPDPYRLALDPIRRLGKLGEENRLPEPLASQVRTLVAMHDARLVLVPLEVAFEPAGEGDAGGRARLRVGLLDARLSEVLWLGEVRSDPSPTLHPGVAASLAARLADLIAAP